MKGILPQLWFWSIASFSASGIAISQEKPKPKPRRGPDYVDQRLAKLTPDRKIIYKKIGDRWQELSPVHHVRAGLPPTLTLHGTGDVTTPFKGARAFHEKMLAAGNRSELVVKEGGAHGYLMRKRELYDEAIDATSRFFESLGWTKSHEPDQSTNLIGLRKPQQGTSP